MPPSGCGRIRERTFFAIGGLDEFRRAQNLPWPAALSLVDCELRYGSRERSLRASGEKTSGLRKDSVPLRRQLVQCAIPFRSSQHLAPEKPVGDVLVVSASRVCSP